MSKLRRFFYIVLLPSLIIGGIVVGRITAPYDIGVTVQSVVLRYTATPDLSATEVAYGQKTAQAILNEANQDATQVVEEANREVTRLAQPTADDTVETDMPVPTSTATPFPTVTPTATKVAEEPIFWIAEDEALSSIAQAIQYRFPKAVLVSVGHCFDLVGLMGSPNVVYLDHQYSGRNDGPGCAQQLLEKHPNTLVVAVSVINVADDYPNGVVFVQNSKQGNWDNVLDVLESGVNP